MPGCFEEDKQNMIAVIRISGLVKKRQKTAETLHRLRLRRKFVCVLIDEKSEKMKMLEKVKDFVAYGEIEKGMLIRLIEKRGQRVDGGKIENAEKIADEILKGKKLEDLGLKLFFRMHPPRSGLKSSKQKFPKGVLGNHGGEINKLIERML